MSGNLHVLTGATGSLGSHIAEQLVTRGEKVRAFVRRGSDTRFLRQIGVELVEGDLQDVASIHRAVAGADLVYHCAARVSDWGRWQLFESETIQTTANLLDACRFAQVRRLLHVSSITVYGHRRAGTTLLTEAEPLGQNLGWWDYYRRAKIAAEEQVRRSGIEAVIVRPSWIYGPRDRNTIPRVLAALRARRVPIIGRGDNLLNIVYAADVADGALRAANHPDAKGQAYNLSSVGEVTQVQLLSTLTGALGLPPISRHVPFGLAFRAAFLLELIGRTLNRPRPPTITRYAVSLIGRPTQFSIDKARRELGWQPRVGIQEGVERTLKWFREEGGRN